MKPIIGITPDKTRDGGRYELSTHYQRCLCELGAIPMILSNEVSAIADYLQLCNGFIFSGGNDPDTTAYGEPVHPAAKLIDSERQNFETELLRRLDRSAKPILGVCLGMQMMALHHDGRIHQHLNDVIPDENAEVHAEGTHDVVACVTDCHGMTLTGSVHSHHHQAVSSAGRMRVVAKSHDDVIEGIDMPGERFYVGVQWHPERTENPTMGIDIFRRFLAAC